MSTIPKARRSQISNLVCIPDSWDSYPNVDNSNIDFCKFEGLNSGTALERCTFNNVNLTSDGSAKSKITRSVIKDSDIRHCTIDRSEITTSKLEGASIDRSRFAYTNITGPKTSIDRGSLYQADIKGKCSIDGTNITESIVEGCKLGSVDLKSTLITNSNIGRANISDCDIGDCRIDRTNFTGMYLRNGVWDRGDLMGRVDNTKEVIIKPKSEMPLIEPPGHQSLEGLPRPSTMPLSEYSRDVKAPLDPIIPAMAPNDSKEREWSDVGMATPPSPTRSVATGILDEEIARPYIRDDYEGPEIESLPPYDEINPDRA